MRALTMIALAAVASTCASIVSGHSDLTEGSWNENDVAMLTRTEAMTAPTLYARNQGISNSKYRYIQTLVTVDDFLKAFDFAAVADPSGGQVNYVNESEARRLRLFGKGRNGGFRFGADLSEKNITLPGRKSLRLKSKGFYGNGLYIWKASKVPSGCGTWPALWTVFEENWPFHGEIDVFEGFNGRRNPNAANIHTGPTCTMPGDQKHRYYSGNSTGITDCNSYLGNLGNRACAIEITSSPLSSPALHNANEGGYHVLERQSNVIRMWFFTPCSAPASLRELIKGGRKTTFHAADLGQPDARYTSSATCDLAKAMDRDHSIIMNLTFCGGANDSWEEEGCLAVAPDCPSWINTPDATAYYKRVGKSVEFDIDFFTFWSASGGGGGK